MRFLPADRAAMAKPLILHTRGRQLATKKRDQLRSALSPPDAITLAQESPNGGQFCLPPLRGHWQCLETFVVVPTLGGGRATGTERGEARDAA